MRKKLLHIMMGQHNPDFQRGLDSVFDCIHFDWFPYQDKPYYLKHDLLQTFNSFNPDVVLLHIQSGEVVDIETVSHMAKSSVVYNWSGDVRHPLPQHFLDIGRHIHSTLFTNVNDVETCLENGVNSEFLQVGFDSKHFNPSGEKGGYPEILFLGTNYSTSPFPLTELRHQMAVRLKTEFGDRFGIYGNGWDGLENGNITTYEEEGKAYRSCKIAINLSHFAYKRYSSDRMFRILGSGAFCLTHYFPEIEKDFKVGEDVIVWSDLDDLVAKIKFYLQEENESERKRIATNGCYNAFMNFTWHHFAHNLEKIIDKNLIIKNDEQRIILG